MLIPRKGFIQQLMCKHEYQSFERPIDRKTNPMGLVALCDDSILVCVKCGKGLPKNLTGGRTSEEN